MGRPVTEANAKLYSVKCVKCGAKKGEPCKSETTGLRVPAHSARVNAYNKANGENLSARPPRKRKVHATPKLKPEVVKADDTQLKAQVAQLVRKLLDDAALTEHDYDTVTDEFEKIGVNVVSKRKVILELDVRLDDGETNLEAEDIELLLDLSDHRSLGYVHLNPKDVKITVQP